MHARSRSPHRSFVRPSHLTSVASALLLAGMSATAPGALSATLSNPNCSSETANYSPGNGQDIIVPAGFTVSVFAQGLNFPVGIAFKGNEKNFQVYVLESGHGLPSQCNDETSSAVGGVTSATNPFTPDILVFDQNGSKIMPTLAKPTTPGKGLQPHGPAVGIGFEKGFDGGRLFVTDSNQAIRTPGAQNNSSRIVVVDTQTGDVTPFITGLPTGDHPTEQLAFKGNWSDATMGAVPTSTIFPARTSFSVKTSSTPVVACSPADIRTSVRRVPARR